MQPVDARSLCPSGIIEQVDAIRAHGVLGGVALGTPRADEALDSREQARIHILGRLVVASGVGLRRHARQLPRTAQKPAGAQLVAIALKGLRPALGIGRIALPLIADSLLKRLHDAEVHVHGLIIDGVGIGGVCQQCAKRRFHRQLRSLHTAEQRGDMQRRMKPGTDRLAISLGARQLTATNTGTSTHRCCEA